MCQLLYKNSLISEPFLHATENAFLENILILVDHHRNLVQPIMLLPCGLLQSDDAAALSSYFLLQRLQDLRDELSDLGLHLEPLKFPEHALLLHH